jgi:hypothetical protein
LRWYYWGTQKSWNSTNNWMPTLNFQFGNSKSMKTWRN